MTSAEAKRKWREDIKASWGNKCAYCGAHSGDDLTLDHVTPKAKGGRNDLNNLVPACTSCNRQKGSTHWLSWWVTTDSFDLGNFSRVLHHIATP